MLVQPPEAPEAPMAPEAPDESPAPEAPVASEAAPGDIGAGVTPVAAPGCAPLSLAELDAEGAVPAPPLSLCFEQPAAASSAAHSAPIASARHTGRVGSCCIGPPVLDG
ncbi:hypothetical protein ACS0Y3_29840, partial [Burkholderia gladioli]